MKYRVYGQDGISKEPRAPLDIEAVTEEAARQQAAQAGMEVMRVDVAFPHSTQPEDGARIGDWCRTLTALRPSGKVTVAGVKFEARSEGQWIDPECECVVVSGDKLGLIVRAVQPGSPQPTVANQGAPALERRLKGKTCLRCDAQLHCLGTKMFHEGVRWGVLGDLAELFVNRESFEVYVCPRCGHVEFFVEGGSWS
jgi:hypothetical protein